MKNESKENFIALLIAIIFMGVMGMVLCFYNLTLGIIQLSAAVFLILLSVLVIRKNHGQFTEFLDSIRFRYSTETIAEETASEEEEIPEEKPIEEETQRSANRRRRPRKAKPAQQPKADEAKKPAPKQEPKPAEPKNAEPKQKNEPAAEGTGEAKKPSRRPNYRRRRPKAAGEKKADS